MQRPTKPGARRARSHQRGDGPRARRGIQIGPRIRVGGTLGKAGQQAKLAVGKAAKMAAPIASFANPALGALLAGAGTALDTSQGKVGLTDIALNAGMNYAGGKLAKGALGKLKLPSSLARTPGIVPEAGSGGGQNLLQRLIGSVTGTGGEGNMVQRLLGSLTQGGGKDGQGEWGMLGDFLSDPNKLLMGGSVVASALGNRETRQQRERAMKYATDSFDRRAPLRDAGMAAALNPARPDLSAIYANPGNAYSKPSRGVVRRPPQKLTPGGMA